MPQMDGMKLLGLVLDLFLDLSLQCLPDCLELLSLLATGIYSHGQTFSSFGHDKTLNIGTQDTSF